MPQQTDYAALAKQFGGSTSTAPADGIDYDALAAQHGAVAAATATPAPDKSWLDSASDYLGEVHSLNPKDIAKSLWSIVSDLPGVVHGALKAQGDVGQAAIDAAKRGDYVESVRHALNYALPLIGPRMDQSADLLQKGEYAKGAGALTDVAAQVLAPELIKKIPIPAKVGGLVKPALNPAEASAVKFLQDKGVAVDAGTVTGNRFVQNIQGAVDNTPLGSVVASRAKAANTSKLATIGDQLAAKANRGGAVTAEQAGDATQGAVRNVVHEWNTEASKAYEKLRAIEADPKNLTTIEPPTPTVNPDAPAFFVTKPKAKVGDVFLAALEDARKNGYTGTSGDLKAIFDDRVESARSLKAATAEGDEYGHAALLKEIRARGGLRPFDKDYTAGAPTQKLRGDFQASQQANAKYYGKNAIYRNDGLAVDDMLQQLSEDPKWGAVITKDTDLVDLLHSESMKPPTAAPDLQHYMQGVGLRPGVKWWAAPEAPKQIPMAVDLRPVKAALKETYDGLMREGQIAPLMGDKATAARALDRLMTAPDHAPLSAADAALGELKSFTRADNPDLRSIGQGKALAAMDSLQAAVQKAAESAGPDAVQALSEGRQATTAKYLAAKVLERVEGTTKEPGGTFNRLTARDDSAILHLRQVLTQAPEVGPHVARAVLDGILKEGTEGGGFAKAGTLWNKWNDLGPQTKQLLFKDPAYIKELDNFFLGAKKLAEVPNPSMSAMTGFGVASGYGAIAHPTIGIPAIFGAGAVSKLLHSPAGVRLLTEGLRLPAQSSIAVAKWTARVKTALEAGPRVSAIPMPATAQGKEQ